MVLALIHADSPYAAKRVGTTSRGSQIGRYDYDTAGNRISRMPEQNQFPIIPGQTIVYGLTGKAVEKENNKVYIYGVFCLAFAHENS